MDQLQKLLVEQIRVITLFHPEIGNGEVGLRAQWIRNHDYPSHSVGRLMEMPRASFAAVARPTAGRRGCRTLLRRWTGTVSGLPGSARGFSELMNRSSYTQYPSKPSPDPVAGSQKQVRQQDDGYVQSQRRV